MNPTFLKYQTTVYSLQNLFYFTILWTVLFFLIHLTFQFKKDLKTDVLLKTHIISTIHGVSTFILCSVFIYFYGFDFDMKTSPNAIRLICFSMGYFLNDLGICYVHKLLDSKLIIHHGLVIIGFLFPLFSGSGIFSTVIGLGVAESSNFTMNMRAFLKFYNLRHTLAYEIFDFMYFLVYIFMRGIAGTPVFLMILLNKSNPIIVKLASVGLFSQSYYFIYKMFGIIENKKKQYLERKSKKVELFLLSVNPKLSELDYMKKKLNVNLF